MGNCSHFFCQDEAILGYVPVTKNHDVEGLMSATVRHGAKGYIRKGDVSLLCHEVDAFCPVELTA